MSKWKSLAMSAEDRNGVDFETTNIGLRLRFADVLALSTCTVPGSPAIRVGAAIAAYHRSNFTGCYVPSPLRSLNGGEEFDLPMPGQRDEFERGDDNQIESFLSYVRGIGVHHASWTVASTPIAPTLRKLGSWHDLAVLERDVVPPAHTIDILGEALLGCRIPCLILPPRWDGSATFHRIAIGWNGSIEATRALHSALPLLQLAKHVTLIDGEIRKFDEPPLGSFRPDPIAYLLHHQVDADMQYLHATSETAGTALLHKAHESRADFVVMGAYSHSRIRERVLGGVMRHVLLQADLPVLIQH